MLYRDSGIMTYFHHHWALKLEQVTSLSQVLNTQEHLLVEGALLILVPEPPREDSHWLS